jgi:hypothetical protein
MYDMIFLEGGRIMTPPDGKLIILSTSALPHARMLLPVDAIYNVV